VFTRLFDGYFGTTNGFAGKTANLAGFVGDHTIALGVKGVVAAYGCALAGTLGQANLANDNLTGLNFLTAKDLNTEALSWTVASILGGTAGFYV